MTACGATTAAGHPCPIGATYDGPAGPRCHVHADRQRDALVPRRERRRLRRERAEREGGE